MNQPKQNSDKTGIVFFDRPLYKRREAIGMMARQIKDLRDVFNFDVTLVHSGAVVEGKRQYQQVDKPVEDVSPNVLAAVGSATIAEQIHNEFRVRQMMAAQVLVTHSEIDNPKHSQALLNTIENLEREGVIPMINANDALERDELNKLPEGADNDDLAASIAIKLGAKALLLCTDVDGYIQDNVVRDLVSVNEIETLDGPAEFCL
jgi:glutamate 5-kinase